MIEFDCYKTFYMLLFVGMFILFVILGRKLG